MPTSPNDPGRYAVAPETMGTTVSGLITPCASPGPRHCEPPLPPSTPAFAVALSGGGFRATLAAIGVLRFLADAELLGRVRNVSSVSGGSIANGLFAAAYPKLEDAGFSSDVFVEHVEKPAVDHISRRSLTAKLALNLYRTIGPDTRTTVLADALGNWFFPKTLLSDLSPGCRFIFNAANLTTGVRFGFEGDVLGDYVCGNVSTADLRLRLAVAVACSAAVPGFFPPYEVRARFPCQHRWPPKLVDGGVYDNTGTGPLEGLSPDQYCLVILNAGGVFRVGGFGWFPLVRDLMRSEGLLYRQSTALRMQALVESFKLWETSRGGPAPATARQGVLFALSTTMTATDEWLDGRPEQSPQVQDRLAQLKTSFGRFSRQDCRHLVYRGWWLTGANLSRYHRELLPTPLPDWEERT